MNKRFLTLFVLTNDASRSRQLNIPVRLIKGAFAASIALFLALAFIVFDYARVKTDAFELSSLKKENTTQRIEIQGFSAKIRDLESQLAKLNVFDKKLRIIANIGEPGEAGRTGQVKGMGGEAAIEEDAYPIAAPSKADEIASRMRSEISQLESRARTQENSFTELQEYLMKRSSMLASTPSIWPSRGWVTSSYGERISPFTGFQQLHSGIDIANRVGTPVVASASGIVLEVGRDAGLGKVVAISHGYGIKTVYGHLSETLVHAGQRVKRGDKVALMGNTGRSTGPHLHYAVLVNGIAVNPAKYILN